MIAPSNYNFSDLEQMLLSTGTATRLLSACLLGGLVGLEREFRKKASGIRTNMLICLGCAFFTMLSAVLAGDANPDKGRVAANIVQGIGFLGAGLILHTRSRVLGLTSAATVFVVASIGMACGAGLYLPALLATVIVLAAQTLMRVLEMHLDWKQYPLLYEVRGTDPATTYKAILAVLDKAGIRLNVIDHSQAGELERITFLITNNRTTHTRLLHELKTSDATDQVLSFRDPDDE
ncbi:putative Mg2+ transporter-C (MgtC) family protein [Granulicella pectinivorans]|jgi:putative Mg2+ transporter-C (MgtC) family protein|uniref:Putative Mg2+ transporter-C (MgtC) family protein n=1 Tax=Granulicella pectinivorans TaxID=474950 RepID=A0A1I6N1L7_9BACT|nr:MgtC/SapB family protein [Granulicella pectinivorans]SFS21761.1 putative Mg2+ transporter-C (MgtC) family protein [Granulicella pectinivorans]